MLEGDSLVTIIDVTDVRASEKRQKQLIHDNASLLHEMQHRVANSLQIIGQQTLPDLARLMAEGGYPGTPIRIARIIRLTTEGVWLDMITMRSPYDVAESQITIYTCAASFFPRHFGPDGLV